MPTHLWTFAGRAARLWTQWQMQPRPHRLAMFIHTESVRRPILYSLPYQQNWPGPFKSVAEGCQSAHTARINPLLEYFTVRGVYQRWECGGPPSLYFLQLTPSAGLARPLLKVLPRSAKVHTQVGHPDFYCTIALLNVDFTK